jgi:hypothetical protein
MQSIIYRLVSVLNAVYMNFEYNNFPLSVPHLMRLFPRHFKEKNTKCEFQFSLRFVLMCLQCEHAIPFKGALYVTRSITLEKTGQREYANCPDISFRPLSET